MCCLLHFRTTLLALFMLLASVGHGQSQKLGHIDRSALMRSLPERTETSTKLETFAKTLDARLKAMSDEYTAKLAGMDPPPGGMTSTERDMAQRDLGELEQRIRAAQEKAQEDMVRMEEELMKPMIDRTNAAIAEVAAAHNFAYIFDASSGALLSFGQGEDILPLVKAKLGIP